MSIDPSSIVISLIIPVYNETGAIEETVAKTLESLQSLEQSWELLLVNDGSTDGTREKIETLHPSDSVRVFHHRRNKGYGAALKTGVRAARGEWVAILDADLTYPIERLKDLLQQAMAGADMVVGARTGAQVEIPFLRRFPKWCLRVLASYLTGRKIPDLNSGFRVFNRQKVMPHLNIMPQGFSFTTTITMVSLTQDWEVVFSPIDYYGRVGSSKIRPIRDTLLFLQLVIRTVTLFQPLKFFIPLALLFEVFALFLIFNYQSMGLENLPDATVAIFAMTGVMLFSLGILADLVSRRMAQLQETLAHHLKH